MSIRELASGLGFPEGPVVDVDGSVVLSEMSEGRLTRVAPDGSTQLLATVGGGPNGCAALADGRLVVCRNPGSRWGMGPWPRPDPAAVEVFRPVGETPAPVDPAVLLVDPRPAGEPRVQTVGTEFSTADGTILPLLRPSDVVADAHGGFYLTDGGTTLGRQRHLTGVLYGTPDGGLHEVVFPLEMPNGIALSPDGDLLYVAETRTRRIWSFDVAGPGRIGAARSLVTIPAGGPLGHGGVDGICTSPDGFVIVATLGTGGYTVVSPAGEVVGALPMDDVLTTNVALSPTGSHLVVTLASSGRVVVVDDWFERAREAR